MNYQINLFDEKPAQPEKITKSPLLAEIELKYKSKIKPSEMYKITSSADCFEYFNQVFNADTIEHHEEFIILLINRAAKVLGWVKISSGGVAGTVVDQRLIFQAAINANASSIIVAHNHPSGNLRPSESDLRITKTLVESGKILEITVLDHLILTAEGYYSFADDGVL